MNDPVEAGLRAHDRGHTLLNLGCGADSHSAYVNVDLVAAPGVIGHDLRQGIPFPDGTYDLVYHSTMLSHLKSADALNLMRECCRVLRPGGVLRVVTEDLEQMCRVYLQKLEAACAGDRESAKDYEWIILELYDQATREQAGGQMAQFVRQVPLSNEAFILSRVGKQGRLMVSGARTRAEAAQKGTPAVVRPSILASLRARARKLVLTALVGPQGLQALELGRFRLFSGQVSYRMYDRYSLKQLFLNAGLSNISVTTPTASQYAFWKNVNLDVSPQGQPARPHALIMEGIRAS